MNGYLADACALIVFHSNPPTTMTAAGLRAMMSGELSVSAITIWEITRKVAIGKLAMLNGQTSAGCTAFLRERGYRLLPVTPEAAERANSLPRHHADPMDRILIATALMAGMTVVTNDRWFPGYGVPTLW